VVIDSSGFPDWLSMRSRRRHTISQIISRVVNSREPVSRLSGYLLVRRWN